MLIQETQKMSLQKIKLTEYSTKNRQLTTINIRNAGRIAKLELKAFNKLSCGLKAKSLEIPHYAYYYR